MLKKSIITTAILMLTSSSAFCAGDHFYVGGSLGLINNTSSSDSFYRGFDGNFSLGYGEMLFPFLYFGVEAFVIPGSVEMSGNNVLKTTWGVGGSLLPGVPINNKTLAYGRIGVIESHFSYPDKNASGGQFGLGMQTQLLPCLDIRGEYIYSIYENVGGISTPNSDAFNVGVIYKF